VSTPGSYTSIPDAAVLPKLVFACGLSRRKRAFLQGFLGEVRVRFEEDVQRIPAGSTLLLWGSSAPPQGLAPDVRLVRLEDGFLRSVGLGADLVRPLSWVVDSRGIYYDATRPSDLEHLLQTGRFEAPLLERAAVLRRLIVENGITKYNLQSGAWARPVQAAKVILVPGQVESDASIRYGAPGIATNMGLLQAVRRAHPDAYLLYKPHPDVVAGLRRKGIGEQEALAWCDEIVHDVPMDRLLPQVDELHLLTSLAGFEALLRGKPVTCYGQPFYAGWGLTADVLPVERRSRRLSLDELVAAALIIYPRYADRTSGRPTTPELALDELLAWREQSSRKVTLWRRLKRVFLRRIVGVR
jgi:capsular polysaccharide export protein